MLDPIAIMTAADAAAAAMPLRLDTNKIPTRTCFSCNGAGHRPDVNGGSPRLCLDCLGEGAVPANRRAELAVKLAYVDREVAILERQLAGAKDAMKAAETNVAFVTATGEDDAEALAMLDTICDREATIAEALAGERTRLNDLFEAFTAFAA